MSEKINKTIEPGQQVEIEEGRKIAAEILANSEEFIVIGRSGGGKLNRVVVAKSATIGWACVALAKDCNVD